MQKTIVLLGIFILMAGAAQAVNKHFTNGGANDWADTNRWSLGVLPGVVADDDAIFSGNDTGFVTTNTTSANPVDLIVRSSTAATALTIGADMNSLSKIDLSVAGTDARDNKITQTAGTVTVSGAVRIGGDAGATGTYKQTGGALNSGSILINTEGTYNSVGLANERSVTTASMTVQNGGTANFGGKDLTVNATALKVGVIGTGTVTQSGAGSAVASAGLNVGSGGAYNLNAGTLTATVAAPAVNGTLTIDGGTFILGQNDLNVSGSGVVVLKSGLLEHTFTEGGDLVQWFSDIAISGGTMDMNGQVRMGGAFNVIGGDATITIDRLNTGNAADYVFEFNAFDSSGGLNLSTIANGSAGYINLGDASITVDGSNYQGGEAVITLFDASLGGTGLNGISTAVNVTGFTGGLSGFITQNQDTDLVTLTVIPEPAVISLVVLFGGSMLVLKRRFS